MPHLSRPTIAARHPVHVTLRVQPGVGHLRSYRRAKILQAAFAAARGHSGMRIVHYAILGNHLHLIVETEGAEALSRGMQGLAIRIAKRLNALQGRRGGVFADRYHCRALRTPREVANGLRYVLDNYRHHARHPLSRRWKDPLSSARWLRVAPDDDAPVAAPRTWLLRVGWRAQGSSA